MRRMVERPPPHVAVVVFAAILAISAAGVLVRAAEADPVWLALTRSLGVGALLLPAARRPAARDAVAIALAGAALAGHFATWFASLAHTTVLRSVVLVTLSPAWVAALEWAFLGRRPARRFWPGIALATAGAAAMVSDAGAASLYGDALALIGGMFAAVYLVVGRSVRARVGIGTYASLVCLAAAACLLPFAAARGLVPLGWSGATWLAAAGLIAGPQLIGHNGLNYALRWVPAATISALTLLEPVGAALLAAALLGEAPGPRAIGGAAVAVLGVAVAVAPAPRRYWISRGGSGGSQPSPPTST